MKTVPDVMYEGGTMVNFNNYFDVTGNPGYYKFEAQLKDTFTDINVEIKLSNTTGVAESDISVYIKKVDAIVSDYNTANGTTLTALSNNSIALQYDFSKPVIIKKGQRKATIPIKLDAIKLDLSLSNAIGLAIDHVVGAKLNEGAESRVVVEFGARNKYDGYYAIKGFVTHPTAAYTGAFSDNVCGEVALVTSGANSVDLNPGQLFSNAGALSVFAVYPRFNVDQTTNAVTVTDANPPAGVIFSAPITTYNSRYVAATKTFYVSYGWNSTRVAVDTLTYCGPR